MPPFGCPALGGSSRTLGSSPGLSGGRGSTAIEPHLSPPSYTRGSTASCSEHQNARKNHLLHRFFGLSVGECCFPSSGLSLDGTLLLPRCSGPPPGPRECSTSNLKNPGVVPGVRSPAVQSHQQSLWCSNSTSRGITT